MQFLNFRSSVVARDKAGEYVIALFDGLPAPLTGLETCVALLRCSRETLQALCTSSIGPEADSE